MQSQIPKPLGRSVFPVSWSTFLIGVTQAAAQVVLVTRCGLVTLDIFSLSLLPPPSAHTGMQLTSEIGPVALG